ncbi:lysophospholipase L2 [Bartonella australis AUST/NH1]|uniref:Lysophospholipase L2 n=1 Tax=Bartonella australis (strain Aust/NH1) TaxID=1094489 RepID=M1N3G2_BARAA|nr:alpha/beta hydrolase [Bartonella australis]AGF74449.1 lysophospholipase L2 [Bartonella australis AUST/NH1]
METSLYPASQSPSPSGIHNDYFEITIDRKIRFAITHPVTAKVKGTIVILESYANAIEEYFSAMNEISQRGFYTAIFDWFCRDRSQLYKQKQNRHNYLNINNDINDLYEFFKKIIHKQCPPPYYMLTYGMGGLIALSTLDLINTQFSKMLCVSPLFAPLGNKTGSLQHKLMQLLSDIGLGSLPIKGGKKLKRKNIKFRHDDKTSSSSSCLLKPPTFRWMVSTLDAIAIAKKNIINRQLQIPTLFVLANQSNIANNIEARRLCRHTHLIDSVTIMGAELDTVMHEERYQKQFWVAFDVFIP